MARSKNRSKKKSPTKRRKSRFGEAAHTARLYIGQESPNGSRVSAAAMEQIAEVATLGVGGGAAVTIGEGRWKEPGKRLLRERAAQIDLVVAASESCDRFKDRVRAIAARAAGIADQTAVLAVTSCAGGGVDAKLVDRRGKIAYPLTQVPRLRARR